MRITIESTDEMTTVDGVRARVWNGVTEGGVPCIVFVSRLAVDEDANRAEFDRELAEIAPPREVATRTVFDSRAVL